MKSRAEFDRRVVDPHLGACGKQIQMIATSTALEAVIQLSFQIHGERSALAWLGPMNRTWPAEDVANDPGRRIADQFQNLRHGEHVTNSPKIDAWHVSAPASSSQPAEQRRGTRISHERQVHSADAKTVVCVFVADIRVVELPVGNWFVSFVG
jgi:hypothetical protein